MTCLKQSLMLLSCGTILLALKSNSLDKNRIQWLRSGDQNTSFFHKVAQGRASKNYIRRLITEEGVVIMDIYKLKKEASKYHKRFL